MKVVWKKPASDMFVLTAQWYKDNLGDKAKSAFVNGIIRAVNLIAVSPRIGTLLNHPDFPKDVEVRSFVEHKNHRIVYYIQDGTICIADIWSTRMKH